MSGETERQATVREALEKIMRKHKKLTARIVVDEVRAAGKTHPLWSEFNWDDKDAADKHRLDQARALIRYVTLVVVDRSVKYSVVGYVRDPDAAPNEQGYIPITSSEIDRKRAEQITLAELDRISAAIERARGVAAMLNTRHPGVADQFEAMLENIAGIRQQLLAAE